MLLRCWEENYLLPAPALSFAIYFVIMKLFFLSSKFRQLRIVCKLSLLRLALTGAFHKPLAWRVGATDSKCSLCLHYIVAQGFSLWCGMACCYSLWCNMAHNLLLGSPWLPFWCGSQLTPSTQGYCFTLSDY
jgi:hypothetical protein